MFTNSLFKDFLMENGLSVWKGESTRDIICLEFNYGSRSYDSEMAHLRKVADKVSDEYRHAFVCEDEVLMKRAAGKKDTVLNLVKEAARNRDCYRALTTDELRTEFYNNGVDVTYNTYKKNGELKKSETLHYKMLYRSTGKAKKGSCMFIVDSLYDRAIHFLRMGIEPDAENPMLVEISAYSPLISSGIVGKVRINPKNILVLKDVERFFETTVISIETDDSRQCMAKRRESYQLKNTLFDGQALIDSRIFPSWGNGYVLLRHHFCKMAAFHADIQGFFRDYLGEAYEDKKVTDMFGVEHYLKDIELITTDNAMKWIKFGKSYEYWCSWVEANGCEFGIVKTAHRSKLGNNQKMSYQMVNSLDENIIHNVAEKSIRYIELLKTDNKVFLDYLCTNSNFSNDYDVLVALVKQNPEFEKSAYFRDRKKAIIKTYVMNFKSGRIMQNAENLTIVGSPYAMLLYAATGNPDMVDRDDTFRTENGTIQCYTERFEDGEYLAFFRSPFNSKNNLTYLHNVQDARIRKYFRFGEQIIAVNMIGTDFQDRNNGLTYWAGSGETLFKN